MTDSATGAQARLLRLPLGLADFARRGFRLDRPRDRAVLETHARSFLTGFNLAARHWRDPHPALATVPDPERGFAYEGAGMYAAVRGLARLGESTAFRRLCAGPGDAYIHLIHVGYGWAGGLAPLPINTVPSTPLLRWLALDGAGFARVYFGGLRALDRLWHRAPSGRRDAALSGAGRALWFLESASPAGVASVIGNAPGHARGELWAGVGLACCYAGCADTAALDQLTETSGKHWPSFGQGALFACAARARAGDVPEHTERACAHLLGIDSAEAERWTDVAAAGLTESADVAAYTEWRSRLRGAVAARS
ncbi:DUF1702 family protein [Haloechinothrix salitolerans]|uniref:DUF1702 family protein n=1 Tax=Haloechinothrix salitolerans TaxID=926830 RepID=A0ABW2BZG4_9PSEU